MEAIANAHHDEKISSLLILALFSVVFVACSQSGGA